MRNGAVLAAAVAALLAAGLAHGIAVSEAKGKVVDAEGQPVVGAVIIFTQASPPKTSYEGKTDKRGNFWVPNLLYSPPGDWEIQIRAEGFYTGKVKVVSRTADRTLLGEFESKVRVGGPPLQVRIAGLGEVTLDFDLSTEQDALPVQASAEDPYDVGRAKMQAGDFAGAVEALEKAVEAAPEDVERRQVLAYCFLKADRVPEAEAQAARAAAIAPDKPGPNLILAEIYKAKGDNAGAWEAIQKERSLAPDNVRVLERVASLAEEMGRTPEALAANEAITRLQPDHAEAWVSLGSLYAEAGKADLSEQAFRKVVELDPANAAQTFYNIGAVIANKADLSDADNRKAIDAFRRAVELKPDYAAAHRELGFSLLRVGDAEGCRKTLERYLALEPGAPDAPDIQATVKSLTKKR